MGSFSPGAYSRPPDSTREADRTVNGNAARRTVREKGTADQRGPAEVNVKLFSFWKLLKSIPSEGGTYSKVT